MPYDMWELSSLSRDQTHTHRVLTSGPPRKSPEQFFNPYSKEDINKWKDIHVHRLEDLILLRC